MEGNVPRNRVYIIIALLIILVALAGGYFLLSRSTSAPGPSPTPTLTALINPSRAAALSPTTANPMPSPPPALTQADDWPMYMANPSRNSWSGSLSGIGAAHGSSLRPLWITSTGHIIVAQPVVAGGAVYVGNWNEGVNFFKLDAQSGATIWGANLGYRNVGSDCDPPAAGVSSSAAIYSNTVYVGGGDNWFYALNAADGSIRWRFNTAFTASDDYTGNYNWAAPLIYKGAVYVGVAALADCPMVQGRLLKLDANTGALLAMFKFVPDGHLGATIWTSPAFDPATNTILVTTGNHNSAATDNDQPYAEAVVQLDPDLTKVIASWRVPDTDRRSDTDWGGTLDVFSSGGHSYAATVSKNGKLYIFDTSKIAAGPITTIQVSAPNDCPQCGAGDLSSPAFDPASGILYIAGPRVKLNDTYVGGTVGAIKPPAADFLWRSVTALDPHPPKSVQDICEPDKDPACPRTPGVIIAPAIGANGVVAVNTSWETQLRDATSGQLLYSSKVVTDTAQNWQVIYGGSAFAEGRMYLPVTTGKLYAYAPGHTRSDDFAAAMLGDQWYTGDTPASSYSVGNGQLQLAAANPPNIISQWPLGGDSAAWIITTSLHFAPAAAGEQAGLTAYQDAANQITFSRIYSGGNYLAFSSTLSGTATTTLIPDDPQQHPSVYLRLSKSAPGDDLTSLYRAAYSYDGSTWQDAPAIAHAYLGLLRAGLYASGGSNAPASFAHFQISPSN